MFQVLIENRRSLHNPRAKTNWFETHAIGDKKLTSLYYSTFIYETMLDGLNDRGVFEEGVMAEIPKPFDASTIRMINQVSSSEEILIQSRRFQLKFLMCNS